MEGGGRQGAGQAGQVSFLPFTTGFPSLSYPCPGKESNQLRFFLSTISHDQQDDTRLQIDPLPPPVFLLTTTVAAMAG